MISAEVLDLFSKACEIFLRELTLRAWFNTDENKRKTVQVFVSLSLSISLFTLFLFIFFVQFHFVSQNCIQNKRFFYQIRD
jgi:nuclear transcription factor Y gamma